MRDKIVAVMLSAMATAAPAQDTAIGAQISIELNTAETVQDSCTLTFVVINGHDAPVASAIYETVLFGSDGTVDRLTLFDFGALPAGRPRVRQFAVPQVSCDALGRVLFNGASTCEAPDLPGGACDTGLSVSSRTGIEVLG